MALTSSLVVTTVSGGVTITKTMSLSGDLRVSINEASIADSTTDQAIVMAVDFSTIQFIYIVASVAMTFETNNATSPTDSWALVANEPWIFWTGSLITNKLTADITVGYITNASGGAGSFQWESLHNTP